MSPIIAVLITNLIVAMLVSLVLIRRKIDLDKYARMYKLNDDQLDVIIHLKTRNRELTVRIAELEKASSNLHDTTLAYFAIVQIYDNHFATLLDNTYAIISNVYFTKYYSKKEQEECKESMIKVNDTFSMIPSRYINENFRTRGKISSTEVINKVAELRNIPFNDLANANVKP